MMGQYSVEQMVGAAGFEPATPWSQTRCATRLRHAPNICSRPRGYRPQFILTARLKLALASIV